MTDSFVPDGRVICPYDSNHVIAQSRLQRHIIKCSKNFPPNYRLCCPYNATHRFPKSEMDKHTDVCPDKRYIDPHVYELRNSHVRSVYEMEDRCVIDCDENWDEEEKSTLCTSSSSRYPDASNKTLLRTMNFDKPSVKFPVEAVTPQAIRPPIGRAIALMMDESLNSTVEDIESVGSFVGIGRGRPRANGCNEKLLEMIGKGAIPKRTGI